MIGMTTRVELSRIEGHRARFVEAADVVIDTDDEEALVDLLRRMAKRRGMKASEAELRVCGGIFANKTIRV